MVNIKEWVDIAIAILICSIYWHFKTYHLIHRNNLLKDSIKEEVKQNCIREMEVQKFMKMLLQWDLKGLKALKRYIKK